MVGKIKKKKKGQRKPSVRRKDYGFKYRGKREVIPVGQIVPNQWNPNEQTESLKQKTRASLNRFGNVAELLVREVGPKNPERKGKADKKGYEIIDGEHRWLQAIDLGQKEIEVRNLGVISDYEAMQLTVVINEVSGAPEPLKLAALIEDLDQAGERTSMEELFPYTKDEIEGLARLRNADQEFLDPASVRFKRKIKANGVPFKMGKRKIKLPEALGKRLILAYEDVASDTMTLDPVVVASRIVELVEAQMQEGVEASDGEKETSE